MKIESLDDMERALASIRKDLEERKRDPASISQSLENCRRDWAAFLKTLAKRRAEPDVYDYLEMAKRVSSKAKKREYLEKAKALAPDNMEVLEYLYFLDAPKDPQTRLKIYEDLLKKGREFLVKDGMYEESKGHFGDVFETRPFMNVMVGYMELLIGYSMYGKAIEVGEEMLKLGPSDHQGIRYNLMSLYAFLGDKDRALKVAERYKEEASEGTCFLLPLAILYFKEGDFKKAGELVKRLKKNNKDFKAFVNLVVREEWGKIPTGGYDYAPDTLDELGMFFELLPGLMMDNSAFFQWAKEQMIVHRKPKTKK